MKKLIALLTATTFISAFADIVTFTAGTVYMADDTTAITDGTQLYGNVSSYQEGDFYLQYNSPSLDSQYIGTYYDQGNDVIHGHWDGGLDSIEIARNDNGLFTLKYFSLTSNTEIGGGAATGNENIFIQGFTNGVAITDSYRIPSDDWGGTFNDVILPNTFTNVDKVLISGEGAYCFGMDSFAFNEASFEELLTGNVVELNPVVPEPATVGLIGVAAGTLMLTRKRRGL